MALTDRQQYQRYVDWCAMIGVPSADFESWHETQSTLGVFGKRPQTDNTEFPTE